MIAENIAAYAYQDACLERLLTCVRPPPLTNTCTLYIAEAHHYCCSGNDDCAPNPQTPTQSVVAIHGRLRLVYSADLLQSDVVDRGAALS